MRAGSFGKIPTTSARRLISRLAMQRGGQDTLAIGTFVDTVLTRCVRVLCSENQKVPDIAMISGA
jgi:hypothetical protein